MADATPRRRRDDREAVMERKAIGHRRNWAESKGLAKRAPYTRVAVIETAALQLNAARRDRSPAKAMPAPTATLTMSVH